MGVVTLASRDHGHFVRLYALKRLHPSLQEEAAVRGMFLDEARIAGLIRHPNVVSVVDVGEDEDGPYLVMDYVEGVTLSELLHRLLSRGARLPLSTALEVVRQIAAGLHAAHQLADPSGQSMGVIHRDISPQNILLGYDGYARLTDFGIAKAVGRQAKTRTGVLKGKMGYLAPEALRFEEPDRRSDLFSLGVVLFECLTMRRLHGSDDPLHTARAVLNEPPPDLGEEVEDAPDELVELMFALLAKSRQHRPPTAGAVEATLRKILADVTLDVPAVPLATLLEDHFHEDRLARVRAIESAQAAKVARDARKSRRMALAIAAVAACLGASSWLGYQLSGRSDLDARPMTHRLSPVESQPTSALQSSGSLPPDESPDDAADLGAPDAGPAPSPRMRRRSRRRRPAPPSTPMWEWQ